MKSWFTTMVVVLGFLLCTGCSTSSPPSADAVAAAIKNICGIIVTVADVAALITKDPNVKTVDGYANMVCSAFNQHAQAQAARPGAEPARTGVLNVDGVPIHYQKA